MSPSSFAPRIGSFERDERLLAEVRSDGRPRAATYLVTEPLVVLGRAGDPKRELHLEAILADRVPVYRRRGGGGAVVLTPETLQVETAFPVSGLPKVRDLMYHLGHWLVHLLFEAGWTGLWVAPNGDIVSPAGRKIAGVSLTVSAQAVHFAASILARAPIQLMESYLKLPERQPAYRMGRGHRDFVGSLGVDASVLAARLSKRISPPAPTRVLDIDDMTFPARPDAADKAA